MIQLVLFMSAKLKEHVNYIPGISSIPLVNIPFRGRNQQMTQRFLEAFSSVTKDVCGHGGLVVPWCNQLRVLSHSSVGGFWSHCGWSSTREGMLCGIPFFTFPIIFDQILNSKLIVEDWKIGWRVKQDVGMDNLVTRVEIARLVQKFMDLENDEVKEFRTRASEVQRVCQRAIAKGGSSETSINAFIEDLSHCMVIEYKVTFLFCMIIKCLAFFFFFFFFFG